MEGLRLSHMTAGAGCAAKLGPGVLAGMLASLPRAVDPNLLVGFDTSDDACVYKIRDDLAVIGTVDFFPPMVDDPYLFGQIAAANALSDIYAMGGEPKFALNLLCVPNCLPLSMVKAILEGGQSKAAEAGVVVAGGHTIEDSEPKYGMCCTGFADPKQIWSNAGAKPGDALILTKPLGTGVAMTAAKAGLLAVAEFEAATGSMATLNKYARDAIAETGVNACTDVTGFGLLGHACEMAAASGVTLELTAFAPAILPGAAKLAQMGIIPQGAYRNREFFEPKVAADPSVSPHLMDLLYDPQTSGGLLFALPGTQAKQLIARLDTFTAYARVIGRALPQSGALIRVK